MRPPITVVVGLVLLPISTSAETWTVNPEGTGDFPDIQSAVNAASDGDEILLTDGAFSGEGNYRVDFLGKAITVRSASGNASACRIECGWGPAFEFSTGEGPSSVVADLTILRPPPYGLYRAIEVTDASPTIRGVTFRHTYSAVWAEGGSPRLEDSILENGCNLLFVEGASPVVTGCVLEAGSVIESQGRVRVYDGSIRIEDCTAQEGALALRDSSGEILGCDFSNMRLWARGNAIDVLFEDCDVTGGRDIYLDGAGSTFVVRNCRIQGNEEEGIHASGGSQITIEGCDIRGNEEAGVYVHGSQVSIRDCLIAGNGNGGVSTYNTSVTIEDCTIASNRRSYSLAKGGGLALRYSGNASVRRTILWGNCAPSGPAVWIDNGTLELDCVNVDTSQIEGEGTVHIVGDLLEENPLFCDPLDCTLAPSIDGDYRLGKNSPALQASCGAMGGQESGCGIISVDAASWGTIKALYR